MLYVANDRIACTPFERRSVEPEVKKAFATVKQKGELVQLAVVIPDGYRFSKGDKVWVRGETVRAAWAGEEYEVRGERFILVPIDAVVLHEEKPNS
jgi:hypothetical protein